MTSCTQRGNTCNAADQEQAQVRVRVRNGSASARKDYGCLTAVGAIHVRMKERRCEGHKNDSTTKLKSDLFNFGQKLHSPVMHLSSI